ncbi:MAG TPA: ATP-binding protein, partial [Pyrinomonadaceae bacterium]|nr:ATP-binding protein [Pyrinomonadaceae bacterium]
ERESHLLKLVRLRAVRDYVGATGSFAVQNGRPTLIPAPPAPAAPAPTTRSISQPSAGGGADVPEEVRARIWHLINNHRGFFESLTCISADGKTLFRLEIPKVDDDNNLPELKFQTKDFVTSTIRLDERVWAAVSPAPLRSPVTHEPYGAAIRSTMPVFVEGGAGTPRGALVAEMKIESLGEEAARGFAAFDDSTSNLSAGRESIAATSHQLIVLDRTQRILYHTSDALKYQEVGTLMPLFRSVADRMAAGASGSDFYDDRDGGRRLAGYRPAASGELSVAVTRDYSSAVADIRGTGLSGIVLSALAAAGAMTLVTLIARRTARRIERVTEGAAAIAKGDLNQRINVNSSDEIKGLASSFNLMSDRLRDHITRESETRQFESFMRLSAMLTHDLKNSIAGLSMLVQNYERRFNDEAFRADAILSLREVTERLRRTVARLSEPAKSLSGEYKRDLKPTDLVSIIKRALATIAEPSRPLYEVEAKLPESLPVVVEEERIRSVVENLMVNALEAMGARGGRLTVEAGAEGEGRVFFSVSDTGVGMSEDFLRLRLFRAFATTKTKGIGLGLYTCREIVEAHGGRLDVESKLGAGTRFRVVLPSVPFIQSRDSGSGGHEQRRKTSAIADGRGA